VIAQGPVHALKTLELEKELSLLWRKLARWEDSWSPRLGYTGIFWVPSLERTVASCPVAPNMPRRRFAVTVPFGVVCWARGVCCVVTRSVRAALTRFL